MALIRAQSRQSGYTAVVGPGDSGLRYLSFGLLALGDGERWERTFAGQETVLVILGGRCDVNGGGRRWEGVGERTNVFDGRPAAVYVPPGCEVSLVGRGAVEIAVCAAQAESGPDAALIAPEQVGVRKVGDGACYREIHDILTADSLPAERLLVGETYNPPGLWSSYPPHKHDVHQPPLDFARGGPPLGGGDPEHAEGPPAEHALEEVYHFQLDPPQGFGIHRVYGEGLPGQGLEDCYAVHDGDTAVITRGYHPVVAAPGYRLYYLWMLAGEKRELVWSEDPAHAWVRNTL